MTSRYVPYATTPARLFGQLISDFVVGVWIAIWVVIGTAVHSAVAAIANFGSDINSGASGIAGNLDKAGDNADDVPLSRVREFESTLMTFIDQRYNELRTTLREKKDLKEVEGKLKEALEAFKSSAWTK